MNLERGYYTTTGCLSDDNTRLTNDSRQNLETTKMQRRYLRGKQKGKGDKQNEKEGVLYGGGLF